MMWDHEVVPREPNDENYLPSIDQIAVAATRTTGATPAGTAEQVRPSASVTALAATKRQFEGMVLQTMIASMLPKEGVKLFGTGSSGEMWKSVLAEKIAGQIAASGRLHLISDAAFAVRAGSASSEAESIRTSAVPVVTSTVQDWQPVVRQYAEPEDRGGSGWRATVAPAVSDWISRLGEGVEK